MEKTIKILLVEDEVIVAMLMQKKLADIGYLILEHVTTGEKAIIRSQQNPPDIILMDIRLAGKIDGIDAAAAIKAESDILVVFITGYDDAEIRERAKKINPLEYLIKPVDINKLKLIIDSACQEN